MTRRKIRGPLPMQESYWSELLHACAQWIERLAMSEEEIAEMATRAYNHRTYGSEEGETHGTDDNDK